MVDYIGFPFVKAAAEHGAVDDDVVAILVVLMSRLGFANEIVSEFVGVVRGDGKLGSIRFGVKISGRFVQPFTPAVLHLPYPVACDRVRVG